MGSDKERHLENVKGFNDGHSFPGLESREKINENRRKSIFEQFLKNVKFVFFHPFLIFRETASSFYYFVFLLSVYGCFTCSIC